MKSKAVHICLALAAATSVALPVFAGVGIQALDAKDSYSGAALDPLGNGFLKIAPEDQRLGVTAPQQSRFDIPLGSVTEPYASLKPWLGTERTASRNSFNVGGILVDVPLGSFVFTPSIGGGRYSENFGRDQNSAYQLRSSLELGYRFDNQSRFSLDYSRTTTTAQTVGGPVGGSALSFTYRAPTGWLFGQ